MNYVGQKLTFMTPLGFEVTIRELNGEDEENLSTIKKARNLGNLTEVIQSIIVSSSLNKIFTIDEIENWPSSQKYYIVLKMRLHSHGNHISFTFQQEGDTKPYPYEEDLNIFDRDLSKTPEDGDDPEKIRIKLYPNGTETLREITTPSGKKFRYTLLNTKGERYLQNKPEGEISGAVDRFRARFMEYYDAEKDHWITLQNFGFLSTKETSYLRSDIKANDVSFTMMVAMKSPQTEVTIFQPATSIPDFFFPEETL